MKLLVVDLGMVDYMEAFDLQKQLLSLRQEDRIGDLLLLLEHPPVLTLGRSASRENLVISQKELEARGANIYNVNRGGDITYHGPGQLVGYPIIKLSSLGRDIRIFVSKLEQVFINLLWEEYGVTASRDQGHTGVWIGDDKITAIGLAVKRWVTMHGFAFNVSTDLSHFDWIVPCGIRDKGVSSLELLLNKTPDMDEVKRQVAKYFAKVYSFKIVKEDKNRFLKGIKEG
ncbi:MAG TPA: lipoyl(octanoyl) transferase LipB [Bacillota bacterium]|nr:lipoyl(octanoyl) transferase LipB [Bacillota bacterium]